MAGILITAGVRPVIPVGGLVIGVSDKGTAIDSVTVHLGYCTYPHWLKIAIEHANRSVDATNSVDTAWKENKETEKGPALEAELREGMQATIAAAIAIDGFYGSIVDLCPPPPDLVKKWREKRLARHKQIAEVLRLSFKIGDTSFAEIRERLKMLFEFRDEAVHPTGAATEPVLHPRIGVATARVFSMYSSENAVNVTKFALNLIGLLVDHPREKYPKLLEHCQFSKQMVYPIIDQWEASHGQLFERRAEE